MTFVLVGCSAQKRPAACAAATFYTSPLFRLAREWARRFGDGWFVLSAHYGLVEPSERLMPYDLKLADLHPAERAEWGRVITDELVRRTRHGDRIVVLAGKGYVDPWRELATRFGITVEEPLAGMGIGQRLHWLTEQLREHAA